MALDSQVAFTNTDGVLYPDNAAINSTGPSTTDGTEFVKKMIDNYMFGPQQALLSRAGLTPDGVTESASASQTIEAMNLMCCAPGIGTEWSLASDPGTTGHRCFLRQGQGILVANYPNLVAAVYVGDVNNAAVAAGGGAFYKADDAAGTIPNTAGTYLILDDYRGVTDRGLDTAASIDPDGASRFLGDLQVDSGQGHQHVEPVKYNADITSYRYGTFDSGISSTDIYQRLVETGSTLSAKISPPVTDGVNGTPRTSTETRMYNRSVKKVIWY